MLVDEFLNLSGWQLRKNIKLAGSGAVFLEEIEQGFFRRIDAGLGMVDRFFRADDNGDQGRFTSGGRRRLHCVFDGRRNQSFPEIKARDESWSFIGHEYVLPGVPATRVGI